MKITWDSEAEAVYIKLGDKPYARGISLSDEVHIDYDADNNIIGIELLCVDKPEVVDITKPLLDNRI